MAFHELMDLIHTPVIVAEFSRWCWVGWRYFVGSASKSALPSAEPRFEPQEFLWEIEVVAVLSDDGETLVVLVIVAPSA
ncbi:hypothetical protein [Streptomyces europaeiscabiei]|uniref:hypothetical protein n=1 Tax=Streptomyces europaeiscabiei TaxID=146819 RepID=UPI0038F7ED47